MPADIPCGKIGQSQSEATQGTGYEGELLRSSPALKIQQNKENIDF